MCTQAPGIRQINATWKPVYFKDERKIKELYALLCVFLGGKCCHFCKSYEPLPNCCTICSNGLVESKKSISLSGSVVTSHVEADGGRVGVDECAEWHQPLGTPNTCGTHKQSKHPCGAGTSCLGPQAKTKGWKKHSSPWRPGEVQMDTEFCDFLPKRYCKSILVPCFWKRPLWMHQSIYKQIASSYSGADMGRGCGCCCGCGLRRIWLFATPWTVAHKAPLSVEFSKARILEWIAISFSRGSSHPRDQTHVSCVPCIGRQILYHWATWGGEGDS